MQVRELQDGSQIATALLVRNAEVRHRREGDEYLKLTLGDRTGTVPAVVLEDVDAARAICRAGQIVHVVASFSIHERYGGRLLVEAVSEADAGGYDREHLIDGPARPATAMEADLRELVTTIQDPFLRLLLASILGEDSPTWSRFREAPAAKHYHQAYRHGLLEHCLTVAQAVSAISATFPGIDRDVAVTGALLHDIGKLDTYDVTGEAISMSDQGRLYGEIALGYFHVRSAIECIDGFPPETAQAVLHIILSHHGSLEHGSPVVPATREATLVHMIDNLGGRLGSFDRVQKALPAGEQWAAFDKGIGGGAFFAMPAVEERRAA
jgi:3'-5' exoribonuclease